MELVTSRLKCDRFDYIQAAYLFWSENHCGQFSEGYIRTCNYTEKYKFSPSLLFGYSCLSDDGRTIYDLLCKKEKIANPYDTLKWILESNDSPFDVEDSCVEYFLDHYNEDYTSLQDFSRSDFVNLCMCYTKDLLVFYDQNENEILSLIDELCDALGYNSRMQLLESENIETPDDMKTSFVNHAMTYLGGEIYNWLESEKLV